MKLNNKGFAITSILYGLLVLFVILVGSYLTILSSQKNRYDILAEDIDETFGFNECVYKNSSENCEDTLIDIASLVPYRAEYTGKYNFIVNGVIIKAVRKAIVNAIAISPHIFFFTSLTSFPYSQYFQSFVVFLNIYPF